MMYMVNTLFTSSPSTDTLVSRDSGIFWGMVSSAGGRKPGLQEEEDDFPGNWAEETALLSHMGKGAVTGCHVAKIFQG